MKVLMLKGLPGSGKSTWAKQFVAQNPGWVRVNKDSIREMMGGYKPSKEDLVLQFRDVFVQRALDSGMNVIVDDTNLHPKHEARLRTITKQIDLAIDFEVKFFDTPLEVCIANDLNRPVSVGERVIKRMWREFLAPKYPKPAHLTGFDHAVICDIDGTVALHNGRSPYDAAKCEGDDVNEPVAGLVKILRDLNFVRLIFVSGRDDTFRPETERWLAKWGIQYDALYMRRAGDRRKDDIVKQEIYDTYIRDQYNIDFVLDDRNRVVDMWRRNGLTCFQVAEGDF